MDYHYKLNCGQYVLHDGDSPLSAPSDTISVAFDVESGTLHKHGRPDLVSKWAAKTRKTFLDAGLDDMAQSILVIEGRIPVEELNRCISNTGYIGRLYERMQSGDIEAQGWA